MKLFSHDFANEETSPKWPYQEQFLEIIQFQKHSKLQRVELQDVEKVQQGMEVVPYQLDIKYMEILVTR